jgi:hypothetical protein
LLWQPRTFPNRQSHTSLPEQNVLSSADINASTSHLLFCIILDFCFCFADAHPINGVFLGANVGRSVFFDFARSFLLLFGPFRLYAFISYIAKPIRKFSRISQAAKKRKNTGIPAGPGFWIGKQLRRYIIEEAEPFFGTPVVGR